MLLRNMGETVVRRYIEKCSCSHQHCVQKTVKELEADKIQEVELRRRVQDQAEQLRDKSTEIERLEKLLEEFDNLAQENDGD